MRTTHTVMDGSDTLLFLARIPDRVPREGGALVTQLFVVPLPEVNSSQAEKQVAVVAGAVAAGREAANSSAYFAHHWESLRAWSHRRRLEIFSE